MGRNISNGSQTTNVSQNQPLPLMGVFSNYSGSVDCSVYDSNFNLISRMTQSNNGNAWPTSGEIWSAYSSLFYTDSNIASSSASTAWIKATPCYSADGHQLLRMSPSGCLAARNPNAMGAFMANCGVVIGPEGFRQPLSLTFSGSTLRQHPRGGFVSLDTLSSGLTNVSAATWNGTSTSMRGAVGYHMSTGTLALIEARDSGCNYRAHIWRNPSAKLTGKPGELDTFILAAKAGTNNASYQYVDFSWIASNSTSYAESQYRMRVIPSQNGQIALFRFVPNNCTQMAVLTLENDDTGTLDTNFPEVACTTSYGIESGDQYGMRHQITWDNKWVAAFAPYYYYGTGQAGFVINTDDPSRYYRLAYSSSSCGVSLIPIRASGFAYAFSQINADSNQGLSLGLMDFGTPGFSSSGVLANGEIISQTTSHSWIDTGYTSTNYPCLVPVENWNF